MEAACSEFPALRDKVVQLCDDYLYEDAAQFIVDELGIKFLDRAIEEHFGRENLPIHGPVQLFPYIFKQGCITTNFDYILNRTYISQNIRFVYDIYGSALVDAHKKFAREPRCLFRLHGEAMTSHGRILTASEYGSAYKNDSALAQVLDNLVAARSLLFLGASLDNDRTVQALIEIERGAIAQKQRHFSFTQYVSDEGKRREKFTLLNAAGINPIWYPEDDHDQYIEDLLLSLSGGPIDD